MTGSSLRGLSLRLWLPLSVVLVFCLVFAGQLVLERGHQRETLNTYVNHIAYGELLAGKRRLEEQLRRGGEGELLAAMAELGLLEHLEYALLLDDRDMVMAATRFAWRGRAALDVLPAAWASRLREHQGLSRAALVPDWDRLELFAMVPVALGIESGQLANRPMGQLLLYYDLWPVLHQASRHMWQQLLILGTLLLLTLSGLYLLLRFGIRRPLEVLLQAMAAIGEGRRPELSIRGHGEYGRMGKALLAMADQLEAKSQALLASEARFRHLSEASSEAIFLLQDGRILDVNSRAEALLGFSASQMLGRDFAGFLSPESRAGTCWREQGLCELEFIDAKGERLVTEVGLRVETGDKPCWLVAARDIRDRLKAQQEIRQLAYFDALSGLPNRRQFLERVAAEAEATEHLDRRGAVAALCLRQFSNINDSLGMSVGDTVLRIMARRLNELAHLGELVARVDGTVFAIFIANLEGSQAEAAAAAARVAEHCLKAMVEPVRIEGHVLHLTACAGLVMLPNDSRDAPELLREAETAMHQAKQQGEAQIQFFAHGLQVEAEKRLTLRNDLRQSLQRGNELLLHYQPQLDRAGRLTGMEALVRWRHPVRGLVSPAYFIPEAEASGLIVPLGNWVLAEAVFTLGQWLKAGLADGLTLGINISSDQFLEESFVEHLLALVAKAEVPPASIELEVTESVTIKNLEATLQKLHHLSEQGLRTALDDFGTGYSSLSYLKRMPLDVLKIDRSFVMDIDSESDSKGQSPDNKRAVLIEAIVVMAHGLGLKVLAEGVETQAQLDYLLSVGCDLFQGFYFSRPLPRMEMEAWLQQAKAGQSWVKA